MNLPQFLNQTDSIITDMKKKELEAFIHEIARTLPESRRDSFLKILKEVSLGKQEGRDADRLLSEAQGMLTDEGQLLENARKYVDQHPQLYKQILEDGMEKGDNGRLYRIGLEAMEKIPENKLIRSEIALLTSKFAYRANHTRTRKGPASSL